MEALVTSLAHSSSENNGASQWSSRCRYREGGKKEEKDSRCRRAGGLSSDADARPMDRVHGGREGGSASGDGSCVSAGPTGRPYQSSSWLPLTPSSAPSFPFASLLLCCCSLRCAFFLFGHYFIFLVLENAPRNLTTHPRAALLEMPLPPRHVS